MKIPPEGTAAMDAIDDSSGATRELPPKDPVARIDDAFKRRDEIAKNSQRRRLTFASGTALLGPFAALVLACHIEIWRDGRGAIVLILAELLALTAALAIAFLDFGESHHRWINERLRAEILRREHFLLSARVGPYLKIPKPGLNGRVEQRLVLLDNDLENPLPLLATNDGSKTWRDSLDDTYGEGSLEGVGDLLPLLRHYLKRVADQRKWFSDKCRQHGNHAWYLEAVAKLILAIALILAAIHLGLLWAGPREPKGIGVVLVIAIFLPVAGAALVGLLSIFGCRRLSVSYAHHAEVLERLEGGLRALESDVQTGGKPVDLLDLRCRRLILETEGVLSNELRLWWLFMNPELPGMLG